MAVRALLHYALEVSDSNVTVLSLKPKGRDFSIAPSKGVDSLVRAAYTCATNPWPFTDRQAGGEASPCLTAALQHQHEEAGAGTPALGI